MMTIPGNTQSEAGSFTGGLDLNNPENWLIGARALSMEPESLLGLTEAAAFIVADREIRALSSDGLMTVLSSYPERNAGVARIQFPEHPELGGMVLVITRSEVEADNVINDGDEKYIPMRYDIAEDIAATAKVNALFS